MKKVLNIVGIVVSILGALVTLGAIGSASCGDYTIGQLAIQVGIGTGITAVGLFTTAKNNEEVEYE